MALVAFGSRPRINVDVRSVTNLILYTRKIYTRRLVVIFDAAIRNSNGTKGNFLIANISLWDILCHDMMPISDGVIPVPSRVHRILGKGSR